GIADVNFRFDGGPCSSTVNSTTAGLSHTWVGDLIVTLISPAGTSVPLINRPGSGQFGSDGNNFCQSLLDDDGSFQSIQAISSGQAPHTGTFLPSAPLSLLDGQNAGGA